MDYVFNSTNKHFTINYIKSLHYKLMNYDLDFKLSGGTTGEFKTLDNKIGVNIMTVSVGEVIDRLTASIEKYKRSNKSLYDIALFHLEFECIHPFQDGNGRVGRLIIFRECLKLFNKIVIIPSYYKKYYIKALQDRDVNGLVCVLKASSIAMDKLYLNTDGDYTYGIDFEDIVDEEIKLDKIYKCICLGVNNLK